MNIRPMTDVEKRAAAESFVEAWTGRGDEKQDAQNFWRMLLSTVYGMASPESEVDFEYRVKNDQTGSTIFIDAYIRDTSVLIEQKGMDIDLKRSYKQSDGSMLTRRSRTVTSNPSFSNSSFQARTSASFGSRLFWITFR